MHNYYQELSLLPQEEIPIHFLWSKVFQHIHLGLVEMQDSQGRVPIGIAFPEYVMGDQYGILGEKLRLFATDETTLVEFDATKCLSRFSDYVHCTRIREVPAHKITGHAIFKRVWPDGNNARLARRRVKRKSVSFEQALAHYQSRVAAPSSLPFIQMTSSSTGQQYPILIAKIPTELISSPAVFSTYGLSSQYAVPLF